ncbi:amidohydrolase family protein, partial [Aegicerativicinus sediminis]
MKILSCIFVALFFTLTSCQKNDADNTSSLAEYQGQESYSVIISGTNVGHLNTEIIGDTVIVDYDYKNNGRGPTMQETIVLNRNGIPIKWDISGNTTFGNKVDEHYNYDGKMASWVDATGKDSTSTDLPLMYVAQSGSPYPIILAARSLLKSPDPELEVLPGGKLKLMEMESFSVDSDSTAIPLKSYALTGVDTDPLYFVLDDQLRLFAFINERFNIIRKGFEGEESRFQKMAQNYSADRFEKLQKTYAHNYGKKVRIKNVRIFNSKTMELSEPQSVVVEGDRIIGIEQADSKEDNEVIIDGNGGTLIPGMYEMHAHTGSNGALLNVLAGVTSVRDMGNNNEVLSDLMEKIENGQLAGPRIHRLGFIEGKSPYNSNNGIIVSTEEEALAAVDTYHDQGFYGIKLYNSMNGDWAPAIVKKAHDYGMFVCGHVPAFSNANAMLRAGFDEMTHINQTMLGWVLEPDEDTRTLLRLTALKRLPELDLNSPEVQETIDLFLKNETAIDPTVAIHEALLLSRNGEVWEGTKDFIKNMPPNAQRGLKVAMAEISSEEDDQAYRAAYNKIIEALKLMKDKGIFIVPGTDLGGSFFFHRELELYQQLGYTPAELLKLATFDMANYLGDEELGIIEVGKLADFFLVPGNPVEDLKAIKTISLVSRG